MAMETPGRSEETIRSYPPERIPSVDTDEEAEAQTLIMKRPSQEEPRGAMVQEPITEEMDTRPVMEEAKIHDLLAELESAGLMVEELQQDVRLPPLAKKRPSSIPELMTKVDALVAEAKGKRLPPDTGKIEAWHKLRLSLLEQMTKGLLTLNRATYPDTAVAQYLKGLSDEEFLDLKNELGYEGELPTFFTLELKRRMDEGRFPNIASGAVEDDEQKRIQETLAEINAIGDEEGSDDPSLIENKPVMGVSPKRAQGQTSSDKTIASQSQYRLSDLVIRVRGVIRRAFRRR